MGNDAGEWKIGQRVGVGWVAGSCGYCESCRRGDFVTCRNYNWKEEYIKKAKEDPDFETVRDHATTYYGFIPTISSADNLDTREAWCQNHSCEHKFCIKCG